MTISAKQIRQADFSKHPEISPNVCKMNSCNILHILAKHLRTEGVADTKFPAHQASQAVEYIITALRIHMKAAALCNKACNALAALIDFILQ